MAYSGPGKLSAVDAILAEATDLVALQQIAKLNTAHLADDSALPSSLESRFRKLKSLPAAAAAPTPVKTLSRSLTAPHATTPDHELPQPNPTPQPQLPTPPPAVQKDEEHRGKKDNSPPQQQIRPPVDAVHDDDEDLERLFGGGRGRPMLRERNRGRDHDGSASPPPPRQACCFGFSPKKKPPPQQRRTPPTKSKKKVHGPAAGDRDVLGIDADENRRMVTELNEEQRKLNKALQEQLEVSRETAKMARWIKQASARMTHTAAIDDLLRDCEEDHDFK